MEEEIKRLEDLDIIEKVKDPVPISDGTVRICSDMGKPNKDI